MAKRSDYHGFDDYKNVVEAPKIYLSNEEFGNTSTTVQNRSGMIGASKNTLAVMKVDTTSSTVKTGFPYSFGKSGTDGIGISVATGTGYDVFECLYDPHGNDLYISGRDASNTWRSWEQLMKYNKYIDQVNSATAKITQYTKNIYSTFKKIAADGIIQLAVSTNFTAPSSAYCLIAEVRGYPDLNCNAYVDGSSLGAFVRNMSSVAYDFETTDQVIITVISAIGAQ